MSLHIIGKRMTTSQSTKLFMLVKNLSSASQSVTRKTTRLRQLIESPSLEFIMEAHSGISAKIAEEAGFKGIWGSGFAIAAQMALRDCNEASWTQVLDVTEFMVDATNIPVLLDVDTGYGNFNNARRLVGKLEKIGVAGCCIEDKIFPKTNSFLLGRPQSKLEEIEEFCGKIKACKDQQMDPDFVVVGRVEALSVGFHLDEALKRAEAYKKAGADAILVTSNKPDPSDLQAFMKEWKGQGPILAVPSKWTRTSKEELAGVGLSMAIWAHHNLRASVTAMQTLSANLVKDQCLVNIESQVAPVKEILRLQRDEELAQAEKKYGPSIASAK